LTTTATAGEGVQDLLAEIDQHAAWLDERGLRSIRREQGARAEVLAGLRTALDRRLAAGTEQSAQLPTMISRVARRELTPRRAVAALVESVIPFD
jgi:LAO/AO transport system kinase